MKFLNSIKKYFTTKEFILFLMIVIIFNGVFVKVNYALDTYPVFVDFADTLSNFLQSGRLITGLWYAVINLFNFSNTIIYFITFAFSILFFTISINETYKIIKDDINSKYLRIIIPVLIILNPFSLELMFYIEKMIMALAILLSVLATKQIKFYFENKDKKRILYAFLIMFAANCCYQGVVGLFVVISLMLIIKYSKNIKEFLFNNYIVILSYGIPAILNLSIAKLIFSNSRATGKIILSESIHKLLAGMKNMLINSFNLLPKYFYFIVLTIIILFISYFILKKKNKILNIIHVLYLILGILIVAIAPQAIQDTNQIWFVARSTYPFATLIGILIWYLFILNKTKIIFKNIIIFICILFLGIQYIYAQNLIQDNYIVSYEDEIISKRIGELLNNYENENDEIINKISIYQDQSPMITYNNITVSGDLNLRALFVNWTVDKVLMYYNNREFTKVANDEELKNYFESNNWDYFSEEQIIIKDGILHYCIY